MVFAFSCFFLSVKHLCDVALLPPSGVNLRCRLYSEVFSVLLIFLLLKQLVTLLPLFFSCFVLMIFQTFPSMTHEAIFGGD